MQVTASAIQYSTKKAQVMHLAFDLTSTFPGTDVLVLIFSEENPLICDFRTLRFASMITHPESKQLIIQYISAPDAESPDDNGTPDHDKADDDDIQDEVPKFKFRREGNGTMVIVDKEQYDLMFPQFKAHAMRKITSKRIPANHRYKIEKRVKDHHRKLRKDAKSKPNAHHKNKKDPGIPNNFPGKEKILQQIADQKLKAQEEKDKQKEIRRKAAEKARKANKARNINPAEPAKERKAKEATSTEGVLSKAAKRKATAAAATSSPATKKTKTTKKAAAEEEEEEDADADAPYNFAEHFVSGEGDEEVEEEEEAEEEEEEEEEDDE
ncbi:hypothetical protein BGZ75_002974 [Mortierella antarctica]|nr:hypothetical protein BGZ75_002974 [Mortierella antarctica]